MIVTLFGSLKCRNIVLDPLQRQNHVQQTVVSDEWFRDSAVSSEETKAMRR